MNLEAETETSVSTVSACVTGVVVAVFILVIGASLAPAKGNQLALPRPMIEPIFISLAAAVAAGLPSYRMGGSIGQALALAIGAAICAYLISIWMAEWVNLGIWARRRAMGWRELAWRRDISVSFFGVVLGCGLAILLGRR